MSRDELTALAAREVAEALPAARGAGSLRATVVREKQATFSLAPGQPAAALHAHARRQASISPATGSTPGSRAPSRAPSSADTGPLTSLSGNDDRGLNRLRIPLRDRRSDSRCGFGQSAFVQSAINQQSAISTKSVKSAIRNRQSAFDEVRRRSLPGNRAEGEQPPVVHRAAGAQPAGGDDATSACVKSAS